jgi:hypothetical protein
MSRKVNSLPKSRGVVRSQAGVKYCGGCSRRRRDRAALRIDSDVQTITEETVAIQCQEFACQPHPQVHELLKSIVVMVGILESHCKSSDGRSKIAQVVLPQNKVKDVLVEDTWV